MSYLNLDWYSADSKSKVSLHKPNGKKLFLSEGDEISYEYDEDKNRIGASIVRIIYGTSNGESKPTGFILKLENNTQTRFMGGPDDTINSISIIKSGNIQETKVGGSRIKRNRQRKTLKKHKTLCKKYKQLINTRSIKNN